MYRSRPAGLRPVLCEIAYRLVSHRSDRLNAVATSVPRFGHFDLLAQQLPSPHSPKKPTRRSVWTCLPHSERLGITIAISIR
jgi:hypothetical protein